MTLANLVSREIAQRRQLLRLINAEEVLTTPASRFEMKLCRETLRATRSEIRRLRKAS